VSDITEVLAVLRGLGHLQRARRGLPVALFAMLRAISAGGHTEELQTPHVRATIKLCSVIFGQKTFDKVVIRIGPIVGFQFATVT
jgi:hypothetical protein